MVGDLFDRPQSGERAVLVHIDFEQEQNREDVHEFVDLVRSAGARDIALIRGKRAVPEPRFFVGSGKAEEIRQRVDELDAEVVIFDHALSPSQERNLERLCRCRVIDRTGLILDIFAQRARSHEGKLQVELAQLKHVSSRLVRGWTHLERQKGGIGLRGPGETQLETDRRLISERMKQIGRRLDKVNRQREQGRRARKRAALPTVSLVGYTNAGKSTLFNRLTKAGVYTADQLFATLDPTLRRLELPNAQAAILVDTVGFIRHLPHDLVAAFRSTLRETRETDLLLHVIDASDEQKDMYIDQVNDVLAQIGARHLPQICVYNKIDLVDAAPRVEPARAAHPARAWVSAKSGAGIDGLRALIGEQLQPEMVHGWIDLPPSAGRLRAQLFDRGAVMREQAGSGGGWRLEIQLPRRSFDELSSHSDLPPTLSGA